MVANHVGNILASGLSDKRELWFADVEAAGSESEAGIEWVESEHPLFLLYTSGSTGKPKGVLHTTGGYMVWAATTFKYTFDYHPKDVYFCTADIGWVTGALMITDATNLMLQVTRMLLTVPLSIAPQGFNSNSKYASSLICIQCDV